MLSATTNKRTPILSWFSDLIFITLLLGVFYAIWIGSNALFTPDEGRYSEVAREMVETGDYITPRLNGVAFLDKPVLYYWLQASAIHLFGLKEWALRFWPAFIGVLGCIVTYLTGRTLFNRRAGIFSALILATCPLYYGAAHYANLDLEVAVLISICLMSALVWIRTQRTSLLITAYVFSGLAFLTKGLIGLFFPAAIIGTWILLLGQWSLLKKLRLVTGLLIFVAITLPWYYLVQKANPQFLHFFFVDQQVSRFLTKGDFNNKTAIWFYLPIVLAGIFPWSIFVIQAVSQKIKLVWQNRQQHQTELFLLLWLCIIFAFFSIPKSKTIGYILPIFPALALMIANYLDTQWNQVKSKGVAFGLVAYTILSAGIGTGALAAAHLMSVAPAMIPYLHCMAFVFFVSGIVIAYSLAKKKLLAKKITSLFVTAVVFLLVVIASTSAINEKSIKPLALEIKPALQSGDEVVTYFKYYQDLPIYLERRITIVADWDAPDIAQNDNWLREMWYGMPFQNTSEWLIREDIFWKKWNSGKRLFVLLNNNYLDRFSKNASGKIYKISQYNNVVLVSNKEV